MRGESNLLVSHRRKFFSCICKRRSEGKSGKIGKYIKVDIQRECVKHMGRLCAVNTVPLDRNFYRAGSKALVEEKREQGKKCPSTFISFIFKPCPAF